MAVFLLLEGDFSSSKKISNFLNLGIDIFLFKVYYIGVEREGAKAPDDERRKNDEEHDRS